MYYDNQKKRWVTKGEENSEVDDMFKPPPKSKPK